MTIMDTTGEEPVIVIAGCDCENCSSALQKLSAEDKAMVEQLMEEAKQNVCDSGFLDKLRAFKNENPDKKLVEADRSLMTEAVRRWATRQNVAGQKEIIAKDPAGFYEWCQFTADQVLTVMFTEPATFWALMDAARDHDDMLFAHVVDKYNPEGIKEYLN